MSEITLSTVPEWYRAHSALHEGLSGVVAATIANLLKSEKIDYLAVSARTKTLESIIEKIERKGYQATEEITDIVGVRVITYIESDIKKVCDLLESAFKVHTEKSGDKSAELQSNEIGYRSVHYVCDLGDIRIALPELSQFKDILFEVQVRTVLQHAWAEIEHDRSYKFSGELPSAIKRRLNLLAGTLEIIDREFDTLAKEVDKHEEDARKAAKSGELEGVQLTSAGLTEYLLNSEEISSLPKFSIPKDSLPVDIFEEMKAFGINTLADFRELITPDFISSYIKHYNDWMSVPIFCRAAMVYRDLDHYFEMAPKKDWSGIRTSMANLLDQKYGEEKVNQVLTKYNISRLERFGNRLVLIPPPFKKKEVKDASSSTKNPQ